MTLSISCGDGLAPMAYALGFKCAQETVLGDTQDDALADAILSRLEAVTDRRTRRAPKKHRFFDHDTDLSNSVQRPRKSPRANRDVLSPHDTDPFAAQVSACIAPDAVPCDGVDALRRALSPQLSAMAASPYARGRWSDCAGDEALGALAAWPESEGSSGDDDDDALEADMTAATRRMLSRLLDDHSMDVDARWPSAELQRGPARLQHRHTAR